MKKVIFFGIQTRIQNQKEFILEIKIENLVCLSFLSSFFKKLYDDEKRSLWSSNKNETTLKINKLNDFPWNFFIVWTDSSMNTILTWFIVTRDIKFACEETQKIMISRIRSWYWVSKLINLS